MTLTRSRRLANLAIAIDSAAGTSLLKKVTDSGEYVVPAFTDVGGAPSVLDSSLTTSIIDSSYIQLRQTGGVGSVLDSAELVAFADSNYITSRFTTGNSGFKLFRYDATANQTTFENADKGGTSLSYNPQGIIVFYNGVALLDSAEYTATTGTSVVLDSGAALNAKIQIASWNIPSSGGGGSSGLAWGGDRCLMADNSGTRAMDYFDMTTAGNAADFGDFATHIYNCGSYSNATRAIWWGGDGYSNSISYNTISTLGDTQDFGDLTIGRKIGFGGACDGTRGVMPGGLEGNPNYAPTDRMDYITVATTGNATDFGNTTSSYDNLASTNDGTYGLHGGAFTNNSPYNVIGRFTIQSAGNAADFGDLTVGRGNLSACSDTTRALFTGGRTAGGSGYQDVIDYVTTATPGNATDFGNISSVKIDVGSASNGTRAVFCAGAYSSSSNTIEYVVIQTPGNSVDLGDLSRSSTGMATAGNAS